MERVIRHCGSQFLAHLDKTCKADEAFEAQEFSSCFTMDTIAATVFGIGLDSRSDKHHPFFVGAKELADTFSTRNPFFALSLFLPFISYPLDKANVSAIPASLDKHFFKMINDVIEEREQSGNKDKVDMIQSLINAEHLLKDLEKSEEMKDELLADPSSTQKGMTREEVLAQCLLMFLAGYDTTGTTLSFIKYNLALHPKIQDKVVAEIHSVIGEKEPTYELASKLVYLEQCIQETMRLYPAGVFMDRSCVEEIQYDELTIPKGM